VRRDGGHGRRCRETSGCGEETVGHLICSDSFSSVLHYLILLQPADIQHITHTHTHTITVIHHTHCTCCTFRTYQSLCLHAGK
jgi:hypothetical protein